MVDAEGDFTGVNGNVSMAVVFLGRLGLAVSWSGNVLRHGPVQRLLDRLRLRAIHLLRQPLQGDAGFAVVGIDDQHLLVGALLFVQRLGRRGQPQPGFAVARRSLRWRAGKSVQPRRGRPGWRQRRPDQAVRSGSGLVRPMLFLFRDVYFFEKLRLACSAATRYVFRLVCAQPPDPGSSSMVGVNMVVFGAGQEPAERLP